LKIKKNKLQGKNNFLIRGLKKNQSMRTKLEKKKHNKLGLNNEIENNQNLDKKAREKKIKKKGTKLKNICTTK
jgi:hypothetical protein